MLVDFLLFKEHHTKRWTKSTQKMPKTEGGSTHSLV